MKRWMKRWIAFDLFEHDFEMVEDEKRARAIAERWLDDYRQDAPSDGWPEDMEGLIGCAQVRTATVETKCETQEEYKARDEEWPYLDQWDAIYDYGFVEIEQPAKVKRPTIVCLCGSVRFFLEFQEANLRETLAGRIVLSIGCNMKTDDDHFGHLPKGQYDATKAKLDELHLRKIDMADEVLILNVNGYIGESTARELAYAREHGKIIRSLESLVRGE